LYKSANQTYIFYLAPTPLFIDHTLSMNLKSGYPFFLLQSGLIYNYPSLDASPTADVIIMGGGISGALTAFYLVNEGIDCIVVDARTIGFGSTSASTSLLQYEIDVPLCKLIDQIGKSAAVRSYQLCAEAIEMLGIIAKEINFKDYQFVPSLYYAAYKKHLPFLREEYRIRHQHGFKVSYLDEAAVKDEYNFYAPAAILSETAAQTNAYLFTHYLLQYSIKKGLRVFDRSPVQQIDHSTNGVTLKTENGHVLKGKKLVYATGYEAVRYVDEKIVDLHSTYACISEQANVEYTMWRDNALLWNTANPYLYMRTSRDRRILIGGRDEHFYNPRKRDSLLRSKTKQLVNDFHQLFPGIDFTPEFSWSGTFGATKDGLPFIGPYNKLPNSLFALGFGGNGITFSLIAAEIIRDHITGKKNKNAGIFSFDRV
jgi:glycine/D-amino acid oxidase-like deaminating enzyme